MLKVLLLRRKIDLRKKDLEEARTKVKDIEKREAEMAIAIDEVTTEEEQAEVSDAVEKITTEKTEAQGVVDALEKEITALETELGEVEAEQETTPAEDPAPAEETPNEERSKNPMKKRVAAAVLNLRDRVAEMVTRDDAKAYLGEVRSAIREKRALTNVGLTIPEVFLGYLRETIGEFSKLYKYVHRAHLNGEGRYVIEGTVGEAIWTECCANLNELDLSWADQEVDCYKVGGYISICNATLEDSDVDLAMILIDAIGKAIGLALDKAILYGRNTNSALKMPMGVVTRLVQTAQPDNYPASARPWVDLHTSNVKAIDSSTTGVALFQGLLIDEGAAKSKYTAGEKVHVMNETTLNYLKAQGMNVNAAGALVTAVEGTMPVIGGPVETLDFIPDYIIISGYFDLYLLAERGGNKFASSEHVKFLQDKTVFKGTARYDGGPTIAEAFVAITVNGASVDATAVTFKPDEENAVKAISLNTSTASVAVGSKTQLFAMVGPGAGAIEWTSSATAKATVDSNGVVTGVASGSATITATSNGLTATATVTVTSA